MVLSNWQVVFDVIFIVIGSLIYSCKPVPILGSEGDIIQLTLLSENWIANPRVKRSAANFNLPDHLSFSIPVHHDDVILNLKRSRLLPMVTSDPEITKDANQVSEISAVFTDMSKGSAMIINRVNTDYSLEGSFLHDGREWNLKPVVFQTGEGNYLHHQVSIATAENMTVSFINDTVLDPEDESEQSYSQKRQAKLAKEKQNILNKLRTGSGRHKRAVTRHVIEVALVVDYEDYSKWERRFGLDKALSAMRVWYTFVAESINIRYQTIKDPDISVGTTVTVLKILNRARDATFIKRLTNSNGQFPGSDGAIAFRKWYPTQIDIPRSDHYMLITGFDIIGSSGIAVASRTCTGYGVSICENRFTGSLGGVAAHELGHSLSAIHDVDTTGPNSCTDRDQYIMSTSFITPVRTDKEGNPWRFSSCSIAAIKAYLSEVVCTLPEHTLTVTELPPPPKGQRAGEILSRNDQCVLSFLNSQSSFCEMVQLQNGGLERLCGGMFCSIPNDLQGFCQSIVPQEYTSCGTNKWCMIGQCVEIYEESTLASANPSFTEQSFLYTLIQETTSSPAPTTTSSTVPTTTTLKQTTLTSHTNSASTAAAKTPITSVPSTSFTVTLNTAINLPVTNTTTSVASKCNYLIFLGKSVEWWNCIQRELNCNQNIWQAGRQRTLDSWSSFRNRVWTWIRPFWDLW